MSSSTKICVKKMFKSCKECGKPLVNEHNLKVLRGLIVTGMVTCSIFGGILGAFALTFIGFSGAGVTAGSWAAAWQGPQVMAGSVFATLQSLGATGLGSLMFGTVGSVGASGTALFVLRKYAHKLNWCECDDLTIDNNLLSMDLTR